MKVHFFKNCRPICYNLQKWNTEQIPVLLVTGLSGSGKTTFAKKYAKNEHAIYISFDVLKFYPQASKQSQQLLKIFLSNYPEIKNFIFIQWSKTDKLNSNDILYNYYCNKFFDFLLQYSHQYKKKIVLEGIQIFVRLHPQKSVGFPIIILRNSSFKCFINKMKRDYSKNIWPFKLKIVIYLIKDAYIYHFYHRFLLNFFILYQYSIHK